MTGILTCVLLQAAMLADVGTDYRTAFAECQQTGKPLLVLVTAKWCPACQALRKTTIPRLTKEGRLNHLAFAVVDADEDRELAQRLMRGVTIPQMILFSQANGNWQRDYMVGVQPEQEMLHFLHNAKTVVAQTAESTMARR